MSSQKSFFQESDLEILAGKLGGKRKGDAYLCNCPVHDDQTASLSLAVGDTTPIVWHCHAGCSKEAVQQALRDILGKPMKQNVHKLPPAKKSLVATYQYYRPDKTLAYEKLRYLTAEGKKSFAFRYLQNESWVWEKPTESYLYYICKVLRLPGAPIIICEGEKDADRLNHLLGDDYVAVTNHCGAGSWKQWMTDSLMASIENGVIICEDNDQAGRKRTRDIAATFSPDYMRGVLRFTDKEVGPKGDVTDWLERGATVEQLRDRLQYHLEAVDSVALVTGQHKENEGRPEQQHARREDYFQIFREQLGDIRRDIFTDSLMYLDEDRQCWASVANKLGLIRSEARELSLTSDKKYSPQSVSDHFEKLVRLHKPRVVIDIPEWDGRDRIEEMAKALKLDESTGIIPEVCAELTKEWLANVFRKIDDPSMNSSPSREFILILQGPQKIGKDYWLRTLLGGFGQWFTDMTISQNERDNMMQLHENAVLSISEFDRTNKMESGMIKDIITKWSTKLRASYARESEFRVSRCSMVASVNPSDILRDSSNSRYVIFPLKGIERSYKRSDEWSMQCLAQGKALARQGFKADSLAWGLMSAFIEDQSPEEMGDEIASWFESEIEKHLVQMAFTDPQSESEIRERGWVEKHEVEDLLDRGGRVWKMPRRQFLNKLYASGLRIIVGNRRVRAIRLQRKAD